MSKMASVLGNTLCLVWETARFSLLQKMWSETKCFKHLDTKTIHEWENRAEPSRPGLGILALPAVSQVALEYRYLCNVGGPVDNILGSEGTALNKPQLPYRFSFSVVVPDTFFCTSWYAFFLILFYLPFYK